MNQLRAAFALPGVADRRSSAAGRPSRKRRSPFHVRLVALACMVSILSGALAAGFSATPAAADDTAITVVTGSVRNAWWVANAEDRLKGPDAVKTIFYMNLLMNMYQKDPTIPPLQASRDIQALMTAVDGQPATGLAGQQGNQLVPGFISVVKTALIANPIAQAVVEAAQLTFNTLADESSSNASDQITATQDLANQSLQVSAHEAEILSAAVNMAHDPDQGAFRTAFNTKFAAATAPTGLTTDQLIANNPNLQILQGVNQLIGSNGSIQTTLSGVKALVTQQFATIQGQWQQAQSDLNLIADQQKDILKFVNDQTARQALEKKRAADAATEQQLLSAGKSAVYILSTLVGFADPKLGQQVAVVGNATIQVADAVSHFADLAAKMGGVANALGSVGGAALTGNILGAVMSVVALFGPQKASPDQVILQQIGQLQQQVASLGQQMRSRFDQVDRELNTIYAGMMTEFGRIDTRLGVITGDVHNIQQTLIQLRAQLSAIEHDLYAIILDESRRPLWNGMDYALGYRGRTNQPLPFTPDYVTADSQFFTWATMHAFDQVATGPANRPIDDNAVSSQLSTYPLDTNVNYLNLLPTAWGLQPLTSGPVPNPRDWYLGARSYLALNLDYPTDAGQNQALAREVALINSAGRSYQAFEQAITARKNPDKDGLNPLFATLLQRYRDKFAQLDNQILGDELQFQKAAGLDPFGGLDQPTRTAPQISYCQPGSKTTPAGIPTSAVVTGAMLIDQQANLGTVKVCVDASWGDQTTSTNRNIVTVYAPLIASVMSTWTPKSGGTESLVMNAEATVGVFKVCSYDKRSGEPCDGDPLAKARSIWPRFMGTLQSAQVVATNQPVLDTLTANANDYLSSLQTNLYTKISDDLIGAFAGSATQLDGVKAAIVAYVQAGMPASLAADEVLSAMLSGSQGILGQNTAQSLHDYYRAAAAAHPTGANIRTDRNTVNAARLDLLKQAIARNLASLNSGYVDGSNAVSSTINRLDVLPTMVATPFVEVIPSAGDHPFGAVATGKSKDLTLTLLNAGLGVKPTFAASAQGNGFSIAATTCGTQMAAPATCTATVRFTSTRAEVHGTLNVAGDSASTPTVANLSGNPAPVTTLASSTNPSAAGQPVTFTATVTPTTATGTVAFKDNGVTTLGTAALSSATATFTTATLAVGSHVISATYDGDANNVSSTSPTLTQAVMGRTTSTVSSSMNPATVGAAVTFTAAVTPAPGSGNGTPTGSVQFVDGTTNLGAPQSLTSGTATLSTASLSVGSHQITVVYSGDAVFNASSSPAFTQTIKAKVPTTTGLVVQWPTTSCTITFIATVSGPTGTGIPTGSVTFLFGAVPLGTVALDSSGQASLTPSLPVVPPYSTFTAQYGGDARFAPSTSPAVQGGGQTTQCIGPPPPQ